MKKIVAFFLIPALLICILGCGASNRTKGGVIGATTGGVIGGVIGKQAGNTAVGAILGAVVGGAAGIYIGNYMDKQAAEMRRDLEGAKVTRVGEGIKITFDSGILFDVDKSALRSESRQNISDLARILNKYEDTNILIEGHTDATGSDDHNMELSRSRAHSVANYLNNLSVSPSRFSIMGYGEDQPIASNDDEGSRQVNRRVEIAIMANGKLKKAAEQASS